MALCRTCAEYSEQPIEEMDHQSIKQPIKGSLKRCDNCDEPYMESRGAFIPNKEDQNDN